MPTAIEAHDAIHSSLLVSLCASSTISLIPHCCHMTRANCLTYFGAWSSAILQKTVNIMYSVQYHVLTFAEPPVVGIDLTTRSP
jgi:hypothetical protein